MFGHSYSDKSVCVPFSRSQLLIFGDKNVYFLLVQKGHFSHGKQRSECPLTLVFQVTLAQNNSYAKVAYLTVTYSATLQLD